MDRNRVSIMFIGILVCVPVLALYQFGLFPDIAQWLGAKLPRLLVLPDEGIKPCLFLQYGYYTAFAFISAWIGMDMEALWQKFAYLLGFSYLTLSLTVTLAWTGILFEPFSGLLAAWVACLTAVMMADLGRRSVELPAVTTPAEKKEG